MATTRRVSRRPVGRRIELLPAVAYLLQHGELPPRARGVPDLPGMWQAFHVRYPRSDADRPAQRAAVAELWRQHGAAIRAEWKAAGRAGETWAEKVLAGD